MESKPSPNRLDTANILLPPQTDMSLYRQAGTDCAGALATDAESCAAVAEAVRERIPVGIVLSALPALGEMVGSRTEALIAANKAHFPSTIPEQADFLYLRGTDSFAQLRCLVLAATDLTGRSLTAEIPVAAEGLMPSGTQVLAALGVLQRMGVSTVVFRAEQPADLQAALVAAAPYARIALGARVDPLWLEQSYTFPGAELFLPDKAEQTSRLRANLPRFGGGTPAVRDHDEVLLAPDGIHAHFIDPTIDISEEIPLDSHFSERLLEAEDDAGAIKIEVHDAEDLVRLEEQAFMLSRPVCLCAEQPELLEQALRIYPGCALYDGTWELDARVIKYFSEKYGMIIL